MTSQECRLPEGAGLPAAAPSKARWWPPFCLVVDWAVTAIIAVEIVAGVHFHH
jgi:hypothetical protein